MPPSSHGGLHRRRSVRWRWDLNPRKTCAFTRFRVLRTTVHHRPPGSVTSADRRPAHAGERWRTGVNETKTEPRGHRLTPRDGAAWSTRLPTMLARVHRRPPPSATCPGSTGGNITGVRNPYMVLAARLSPAELPAPPARPARPPWCGECDQATRMLGYDGDAPRPFPAASRPPSTAAPVRNAAWSELGLVRPCHRAYLGHRT